MNKHLYYFLLCFVSITANARENDSLVFKRKWKTIKLSLRQKDNAIIQDYTKDKIEMQHPKSLVFSENKI